MVKNYAVPGTIVAEYERHLSYDLQCCQRAALKKKGGVMSAQLL